MCLPHQFAHTHTATASHQAGTPVKVLRDDTWRSAVLRRMHRDGSFKVTFRDGSTEERIPVDRIAVTSDTARALHLPLPAVHLHHSSSSFGSGTSLEVDMTSATATAVTTSEPMPGWHVCSSVTDAYSDEHLDEMLLASSSDYGGGGGGSQGGVWSVALSCVQGDTVAVEKQQSESSISIDMDSPDSSNYAMNGGGGLSNSNTYNKHNSSCYSQVHSFRMDDIPVNMNDINNIHTGYNNTNKNSTNSAAMAEVAQFAPAASEDFNSWMDHEHDAEHSYEHAYEHELEHEHEHEYDLDSAQTVSCNSDRERNHDHDHDRDSRDWDRDRSRLSSIDSVLSDGGMFGGAADGVEEEEEEELLMVVYDQAPLGFRLSSCNARTVSNSPVVQTNNSNKSYSGLSGGISTMITAGSTSNRINPITNITSSQQPEVTRVVEGGRSAAGGVCVGDVLVLVGSCAVRDYEDAMDVLQTCTYPLTLQFRRPTTNPSAAAADVRSPVGNLSPQPQQQKLSPRRSAAAPIPTAAAAATTQRASTGIASLHNLGTYTVPSSSLPTAPSGNTGKESLVS